MKPFGEEMTEWWPETQMVMCIDLIFDFRAEKKPSNEGL